MTTCDRHRVARAVLALCAIATHFWALPARAQLGDPAAARPFFEEGRALMKVGRYDQACPKLEAAAKLYPGSGILLNLGDCHERFGLTASAWRDFGNAATAAARLSRPQDEAEARRRRAALEPRLRRIVIRIANEGAGLVVKLDGGALDRADWGTPVPVDPGPHTVTAESSERFSWSNATAAIDAGKTLLVDVPVLRSSTSAPPTEPATPATVATAAPPTAAEGTATTSQSSIGDPFAPHPAPVAATESTTVARSDDPNDSPGYWTGRRILGAVIAGAGVAGLATAGILGFSAKSQYDTANGESGTARHDDSLRAVSTGNVATAVLTAAAVVTAVGGVVWFTAPSARVAVGAAGSSLLLQRTFQ